MMFVIGGREVGQVEFCKLAKKQGFSSSGDSFPTTALDLAAGADPALIELPFCFGKTHLRWAVLVKVGFYIRRKNKTRTCQGGNSLSPPHPQESKAETRCGRSEVHSKQYQLDNMVAPILSTYLGGTSPDSNSDFQDNDPQLQG